MRVLLLKGESQYDVLKVFIDQLSDAFTQLGLETETINLLAQDAQLLQAKALARPVDFIFSFNLGGCPTDMTKDQLFNFLQIPWVSMMVDHPTYLLRRLNCGWRQMAVAAVDKSTIDFIHDFLPEIHHAYFLPQAAILPQHDVPVIPSKDRPIDVFLPGTYYSIDEAAQRIRSIPSPKIRDLYFAIAEEALAAEWQPLVVVTKSVLLAEQLYSPELLKSMLPLLSFVDMYIRAFRRETAVSRLVKKNIKVAVCSDGWRRSKHADSLTIYPVQPVLELANLTRQAKICLDVGVSYSYGGHERSLTAMVNHTPVIVHRNQFYTDHFEEGKHLLQFSYNQPDELTDKISQLLNDHVLQATLACEGQTIVRAQHTWLNRAQVILAEFAKGQPA